MTNDSTRRWEGSALILVDATGRVLLQQRDDDTPPEGHGRWAIPGGGHEGEESARETAIRELEEETGLQLERVRHFRTYEREQLLGFDRHRLHLFYADDEVDEAAIVCNEGLAFQFWSPAEATALRMNPAGRQMLDDFLASDQYRGTVAMKQPYRRGVSVIELDRWGRVLLQLRDHDLPPDRFPGHWSLPGGIIEPGESPDAAAIREFEEETGHLLEDLKLYRVFRKDEDIPSDLTHIQHVYYVDADLEEDEIDVREGEAFRYFAPSEVPGLKMPPHGHIILGLFFESGAYKALFH